MKIEPSGKVTVMTGEPVLTAQGEETTFAQIVGDELGVEIDDILEVLRTAIVRYGIRNILAAAGRAVGGPALYFALLQDLKAKVKKFGAMLLDSDDVSYSGGQVVCNKTGASKKLAEIAGATYRAMKLPPNTGPAGFDRDAFLGAG